MFIVAAVSFASNSGKSHRSHDLEHKFVQLPESSVFYTMFKQMEKRDEVTGEWRKLHSEELHILYSYSIIIRQMK
jgi:hypothetical protein